MSSLLTRSSYMLLSALKIFSKPLTSDFGPYLLTPLQCRLSQRPLPVEMTSDHTVFASRTASSDAAVVAHPARVLAGARRLQKLDTPPHRNVKRSNEDWAPRAERRRVCRSAATSAGTIEGRRRGLAYRLRFKGPGPSVCKCVFGYESEGCVHVTFQRFN